MIFPDSLIVVSSEKLVLEKLMSFELFELSIPYSSKSSLVYYSFSGHPLLKEKLKVRILSFVKEI